jgi:hypothetical protein
MTPTVLEEKFTLPLGDVLALELLVVPALLPLLLLHAAPTRASAMAAAAKITDLLRPLGSSFIGFPPSPPRRVNVIEDWFSESKHITNLPYIVFMV